MKRHGKLFKDIVKLENIYKAHKNAKKGKSHYKEVQMVEDDLAKYLTDIKFDLENGLFSTSDYVVFKIHEPKEREIFKLPYFPDRIVHHAIMNILQPIWDEIFIYDVYSAIPGKGIHSAMDRLDEFLKDKKGTKYCLQFDISKFYPSVNHDILMKLIQKKIKCSKTLGVIEDIVRSPHGSRGIPIGNYTSQYFANIYLNWFDHFIKQELGMNYYIRYADDGIIFSDSKEELHDVWSKMGEYLNKKLKLELNPKTQIFPVDSDRGIDFLGYRTFRSYRLLRKRSAKKFKRKIKKIKRRYIVMEDQHIISSIMSYVGWIKHCDGFNLLQEYIYKDEKLRSIIKQASERMDINNPLKSYIERNVNKGVRRCQEKVHSQTN